MVSLTGSVDAGEYSWELLTRGGADSADVSTALRISRGHKKHTGGFEGPPTIGDLGVNYFTGNADGFPSYVIARFLPNVAPLIITTTKGNYNFPPGEMHEHDGLLYVARLLHAGEEVLSVGPATVPHRRQNHRNEGAGWRPRDDQ